MSEFTDELWEDVSRNLRWRAGDWWMENRETLTNLSKDEIEGIALGLKAGSTTRAKLALAKHMSREEWKSYRDGTTAKLTGLAKRRAAMLRALEDLAEITAKAIGRSVLVALGVPL